MLPMMPGTATHIQPLPVNLILSTVAFYIIAQVYVLPKLRQLPPAAVLLPILLLHSFRHEGLMFLATGATYPGMPSHFAFPAALGDLIASLLAFVAIPLVLRGHPAARLVLWALTIEGTIDLIVAVGTGFFFNAAPFMGSTYWIPAFYVPALLVTHYVTALVLLQRRPIEAREADVNSIPAVA